MKILTETELQGVANELLKTHRLELNSFNENTYMGLINKINPGNIISFHKGESSMLCSFYPWELDSYYCSSLIDESYFPEPLRQMFEITYETEDVVTKRWFRPNLIEQKEVKKLKYNHTQVTELAEILENHYYKHNNVSVNKIQLEQAITILNNLIK